MLGLHHLLWVSTIHCEKARQILIDVDQSCYGFAATSMNFSLMALNALRSGFLTTELRNRCKAVASRGGNGRQQVSPAIAVTAELYGAILHRHYRMWRGGRKQRKQIGFVMKDLGDEAGSAKGVRALLAQYSLTHWEKLNLEAQIAAGGGREGTAGPGFSAMDDGSAGFSS
eukprot:COSAG02_NODE_218_length_28570_cov_75.594816_20_plen_171_part_00